MEAVGPSLKVGGLRDDLHLVLVVGNDLSELVLDVVGVNCLATNRSEGLGGALELALLDEETGRLRQEEETSREDDGPQELHGDGDTVGSGIITVLGGVDHAVGEQDTDGDAELVTGHEGTADLLGRDLGHVQNDDGRDESDTETGNQATHDHDGKGGGGSLQDGTNGEDGGSENNSWATTDEVGDITRGNGTEEGTAGQNRGHEGLVTGRNVETFLVCEEGVRGGVGTIDVAGVGHASVLADEVWHGENTTHPSGIISEKDATKGSKGTHEVCLKGHGGLDTLDLGRATDDSIARHFCCCFGGLTVVTGFDREKGKKRREKEGEGGEMELSLLDKAGIKKKIRISYAGRSVVVI